MPGTEKFGHNKHNIKASKVCGYVWLVRLIYFIIPAEKPWSSSLCHSLLRHTYVDLLLCYVKEEANAQHQQRTQATI